MKVQMIYYVDVWLSNETCSTMANPHNKTFTEFVFSNDVIACQFNGKAECDGKPVDIDHLNSAKGPLLFISEDKDIINKFNKRLDTFDRPHEVVMNGKVFKLTHGAKFDTKEAAEEQNKKPNKTASPQTVEVDFDEDSVGPIDLSARHNHPQDPDLTGKYSTKARLKTTNKDGLKDNTTTASNAE